VNNNEEHKFLGFHVIGEMYGVDFKLLNNLDYLEKSLKLGIKASGATLCSMQSKKFEPCGITILGLLSESHASIHTYPDSGSLFFDAFTCGTACDPQKIAQALVDALSPANHTLKVIPRGEVEKDSSLKVVNSN
jgi:S-adenosylmethionine decarboxylase